MKRFASMFAVLAALLGMISPALAKPAHSALIVPGRSIGKMSLGPNGTAVLKRFRKPDIADSGMSQTRQVWLVKGNRKATLFIHTSANGALDVKPENGVTIDTIRTSSPSFRTVSGVAVGSTLAQVRRHFPRVRRNRASNHAVIYSDPRRGIAFEFASNMATAHCIGITVFRPGHNHIVTREDVSRLINDNQHR